MFKERSLANEKSDVKLLRQWERDTLREVDDQYDPDDDSSDAEAIAERTRRTNESNWWQAEEEAKAVTNKNGKK